MHATAPPTDEKVPVGHGRHAAVYVPGKQVDADDFSRVSSSNRGSSALIIIPCTYTNALIASASTSCRLLPHTAAALRAG